MNKKVLIDTNIYSYHSVNYPDAVEVWNKNANENSHVIISPVQITELLSYLKIERDTKLKEKRESYISLADEVVEVDEEIARKAADIRRDYQRQYKQTLGLADSIIAATAIEKDAILISNNDQDFVFLVGTYGLNYFNPIKDQSHLRNFKKNLGIK